MSFLENVYRLMNRYNQKMKTPRYYGTEDLLYPAEVHLLEVIGSGDGITTTELAARMAITKGAVSQTTARLMAKGLVQKHPAPGQKREQLFTVTEKGDTVFAYHRHMHRHMLEGVETVLCELPQESRQVLERIFEILEKTLDEQEEAL